MSNVPRRALLNCVPAFAAMLASTSATLRTFNFCWKLFRYYVLTFSDTRFAQLPASYEGCDSDFFLSSAVGTVAEIKNVNTSISSSKLNTSPSVSRLNGISMFSHPVIHENAASMMASNFAAKSPPSSELISPISFRCWLSVGALAKILGCGVLSTSHAKTIVRREFGSRLRGINNQSKVMVSSVSAELPAVQSHVRSSDMIPFRSPCCLFSN